MGCAVSCLHCTTMSLFGRNSNTDNDIRAITERKLYIAKESPEPIFDLSECQLRQVPSGIYAICKVYRKECLSLHHNQLSSLQHGGLLSDLYLIKVLDISFNNFSYLPSDIKCLINLSELYIQNNKLTVLPENIGFLKHLQILDASNNCLNKLTAALGKLQNLQILKIKGNKELINLCPELCYSINITKIELDEDQFVFPPAQVALQGTVNIMKYLCDNMNVEYSLPSPTVAREITSVTSTACNPFTKHTAVLLEEQEAVNKRQELIFHKAAKLQKEQFLTDFIKEQSELDAEIAKIHEVKEVEKLRLIQLVQDEEKEIEFLVRNFSRPLNLNHEIIQQQIQHEQVEHDRLLEITRQKYDNLRKADVLKAMETILDQEYITKKYKKNYSSTVDKIKESLLIQELDCSGKMENLLKVKDQSRSVLIQQLLEDQDIQKAIVASLVEKVDARSWSLNQEISLISSHLAKLSTIEQEKRKLNLVYNFNELSQQRMHLLNVLDDLLSQQSKRRLQLIETLKEMENQRENATDFWLKNYQKVIETAPKTLLGVSKTLDPLLANFLLQEGVIHCLPFLFKFLFLEKSLSSVTYDKLKENGVTLLSDREGIIRAIDSYLAANINHTSNLNDNTFSASAPPSHEICTGVINSGSMATSTSESECVICMDSKCEVIFIPCGHLCCCQMCSGEDMDGCPMCRGVIEKKIKIIIA